MKTYSPLTGVELFIAVALLAIIMGGFCLLAIQSNNYHQERMEKLKIIQEGRRFSVKQAGQLPMDMTPEKLKMIGPE